MAPEREPSLNPGSAAVIERSVIQNPETQSSEPSVFQKLSDRWQAFKERSFGEYLEGRRQNKVRDYESAAVAGEQQAAQLRATMTRLGLEASPATAEALGKLQTEIDQNRERSDEILKGMGEQTDGRQFNRNEAIERVNQKIREKEEEKKKELIVLKKALFRLEEQKKVLDGRLKSFQQVSNHFVVELKKKMTRAQKKSMDAAWSDIAKEYQKTADISFDVEDAIGSIKRKIQEEGKNLEVISKSVERRKIPTVGGNKTVAVETVTNSVPAAETNAESAAVAEADIARRMKAPMTRKFAMPRGAVASQ